MGNSPSGPEGRGSTRLSKPARSQEPSPEPSSLSPTAPVYQQREPPHASIASVLRPTAAESQLTLRQSRAEDTAYTHDSSLHHSVSNESLSHFVTPHASRSQLVSPSQPSFAFDPKQVDLPAALAILEELRKTASPEDLVALHRALLPVKTNTIKETPFGSTNAARHDSFAAPTTPPKEVDGLPRVERKPVSRSTSWKPEMLGSSPLSKLEKLGNKGSDEKDAPVARATTPADMEHLGSMQLGTLKVVNGVPASPGPSIADTLRSQTQPVLAKRPDEEYFTAEESEEEAVLNKEAHESQFPKRNHDSLFGGPLWIDTAPVQAESTATVDSVSTLRAHRSGSPLKNQVSRDSSVRSAAAEQQPRCSPDSSDTPDTPSEKRESLKNQKSTRKRLSKAEPVRTSTTRLRDMVDDDFDDPVPVVEPKVLVDADLKPKPQALHIMTTRHTRNQSSVSAADLASEYQAGLPDSPFSPVSPLEEDSPENTLHEAGTRADNNNAREVLVNGAKPTFRPVSPESPDDTPISEATDNDDINPYAPWHSHTVTRQTALGSHPIVTSEQSSLLLSPSHESSERPIASSRPSQQSDSGYSTASHNGHAKSTVETFAQTRLEVEHGINDTAPSRESSPFEPILHHSMLGSEDDQAAPLSNAMDLTRTLTTKSSNVSSVVYSPTAKAEAMSSDASKSWRISRLRLSRLLSSDSVASKDKAPSSMAASTETVVPVKTPKKLKKKRPASELPAPAFDLSIPDIPAGMATKFGDRHDLFEDFDGSHPHVERRIILTEPHEPAMHDDVSRISLDNVELADGLSAPVPEPMHPARAPPPLPDTMSTAARVPQQRRSSLTRLLRPKKSAAKDSSYGDDGVDGYAYPPEFASMGSISQSLGASPYDFATHKPAPKFNNASNGYVLPFPRAPRPRPQDRQDRRRPKSYHGRSMARKMEMVGEESVEDMAHDDMMSSRHNQRPSMDETRSDYEQQHNKIRPKSSGQADAKKYIPYRDPSVRIEPPPPLPTQNKPSWSGPRDTWRQHRELASRNVQSRQPESSNSPPNLGTVVISGPALSPIELPSIGAKPRARPQSQQKLQSNVIGQTAPLPPQLQVFHNADASARRPRPMSTLAAAKSQPDLRAQARFYTSAKSDGRREDFYQNSAASPSATMLGQKPAWAMAQEV